MQLQQQSPNSTPAQPQQVNDQPLQGTAPTPQQQPQGEQLVQPGPPQKNPATGASTPQPNSAAAPQGKPSPGTPASSGTVNLRLDPPTLAPAQGSSFNLNVLLAGGQDVASVPLQITYDPKVMQFVSVSPGGFLGKDGQPVALVHRDDPTSGTLQVSAQRPPGTAGISGGGVVFSLMFTAREKGSGVISITTPGARNSQNQSLQVTGSQTAVNVN